MTHRRNAKNKRAHVNGLKKRHDEDQAEETSEDHGHGKDHGEQARKGGHQPSGATTGLQLQTVQAAGPRERSAEDEGAVANQRRAEKIQRLVQLYSAMDLTGLPPRQRVQQEQKMGGMYGTQSEGWLDKSLAAVKQLQERTPPRPTEDEDIVLQVRRGLGMRKMARPKDPHAVKQLLGIKARATKQIQDALVGLHTRLTQLIEEVEYLHGSPTPESPPGAPWLLLCRNAV
jgi:hypothetical protein